MGMFLNYQNLADNYMPNNLVKAFPTRLSTGKLDPIDGSKPFEEYGIDGTLKGYSWRQGETLNLEFNIDGEITLEPDAIVLSAVGQEPTEQTMGRIGQKIYNIVDLRMWKCDGFDGKYIWNEYPFEYPSESTRCVYVSANDYLKDKNIEVVLYNFRMEPIYTQVFEGSSTIIVPVDKELSSRMPKGIYYCSLTVSNALVCYKIFDASDCVLLFM